MKTQQQQQGISLLEILLVLAIAAIIVSIAISYYTQTLITTRVSQAASLIEQINKAGYEWRQIPDANGVYPANFTGLSIGGLNALTAYGLLPCENQSCFTNPWGGATMVTADRNPQYMLIKMTGVPVSDCMRLREQMKNIAPAISGQQNACLGSQTVNYQIYL